MNSELPGLSPFLWFFPLSVYCCLYSHFLPRRTCYQFQWHPTGNMYVCRKPRTEIFWKGEAGAEKVDPEPLAILLICGVVAGFVLSCYKRDKSGIIINVITGVIALVLSLSLKGNLDSDMFKEGDGMFRAEYGLGFWLMMASYLCVIGLNIYLLMQSRASPVVEKVTIESP